jgi:hypothetical protein
LFVPDASNEVIDVVATLPFTVEVKVDPVKLIPFVVLEATILVRELLASELKVSGPLIVVVPFKVVLVAVRGPEILVVAKFVVPVAVRLPVFVSPKFAIEEYRLVNIPVVPVIRFEIRFCKERLVPVAFRKVKLSVLVVEAFTELNTGLLEKE